MSKWLLGGLSAPFIRVSTLLVAVTFAVVSPLMQAEPASASVPDPVARICMASPPAAAIADYYNIRMAPTGRAPGAVGYVTKTFAQSPFGIAVSVDGRYVYDVHLAVDGLRGPPNVEYTVWVAPPNLSPIVRLGVLDQDFELRGQVDLNKFIMFVTAEQPGSWDPENVKKPGNAWKGPILMQGISRSGLMHSASGHGPFEVENC
jgi:hypothetical protein